MNFLLKNIELSLSEAHLLAGEKLFEEQKVTALVESERNLWVADVEGFEAEIQITPSRVKACSCECEVFLNDKMCGHVAAGLLALRRRVSEKKKGVKRKAGKRNQYQKLTVNAILDQADKEEMSAFIRNYAKRNRHFTIALKTRFAGAVPMYDNAEKYSQLVDLVIKSSRNKNEEISVPGIKQILATGKDLLGQAYDSIALEHFVEGWAVLFALLNRVVPIANKLAYETAAFLEFTDRVFDGVEMLLDQPIPPSLQEDVWQFLLQTSNRLSFRGHDRVIHVLKLLIMLADDSSRRKQLLHTVDLEWKRQHLLTRDHTKQLLVCKLEILSKRGFKSQLKVFFEEIASSPDQILFAVETAFENGLVAEATLLADKGLRQYEHPLFQYKLKTYLLEIALQKEDQKVVVGLGKDCFVFSGNLKYLRMCKQYFEGEWESFLGELAIDVANQNPKKKNEILADLYAEESNLEMLGEIIRKRDSLKILMKYDHFYLPKNQKELEVIYKLLLDKYLSNHLGIKPTEKILKIFAHLRKQNAHDLVEKLVRFIREKYPQRMELAMELLTL